MFPVLIFKPSVTELFKIPPTGNLIFRTHAYHNTDNSFKGKANIGILVDGAEVPDGTYYYILKVFDPAKAKTHVYNGFFVIKRK
jgi:hypothetical protein